MQGRREEEWRRIESVSKQAEGRSRTVKQANKRGRCKAKKEKQPGQQPAAGSRQVRMAHQPAAPQGLLRRSSTQLAINHSSSEALLSAL
jgi:hypothetical protein